MRRDPKAVPVGRPPAEDRCHEQEGPSSAGPAPPFSRSTGKTGGGWRPRPTAVPPQRDVSRIRHTTQLDSNHAHPTAPLFRATTKTDRTK